MDKIPVFSAVIFDMDGLVLDTESTYCIAWKMASNEMGNQFSEAFCLSLSGLHSQDVEQKLINHCSVDFDLAKFGSLSGQYWREYVSQFGILVKKGFFELLELLKANNIPFCLATNSKRVNALECLKLAKLEGVFNIIVARDDVKQGKPNADIFLFAAEALKIGVDKCLVVEDSAAGIQAAVNAKAPSVFIPSVLPFDKVAAKQADCLTNDLGQLAQIILSSYRRPV